MANEQNLIPYQFTSEQSREEAAKNGAKGGIASGIARRRKRSLREAADYFLSLPVTDTDVFNRLVMDGLNTEDIDNQMALVVGLTKAAASGDSKAAKALADFLGEGDAGKKQLDVNFNDGQLEFIANQLWGDPDE